MRFQKIFLSALLKISDIRKIKISGQKNTIEQLKGLSIISGEFGEQVYLKDIANIYINYDSEGQYGLVNNKQAISLDIKRAAGRNSLKMAKILENYVADFQKNIPTKFKCKNL